jgi:hypothetical protein
MSSRYLLEIVIFKNGLHYSEFLETGASKGNCQDVKGTTIASRYATKISAAGSAGCNDQSVLACASIYAISILHF